MEICAGIFGCPRKRDTTGIYGVVAKDARGHRAYRTVTSHRNALCPAHLNGLLACTQVTNLFIKVSPESNPVLHKKNFFFGLVSR